VQSEYRRLDAQFRAFQKNLEDIRELPAETLDGYRVSLYANVGLLADLDFADAHGAEGVGLFRTELPFLSYRDFPSENEQVSLYRTVIERMGDRPVTIRTLDIGADKYPAYVREREQKPVPGLAFNPRLARRGDDLSGAVRAILRAAGHAPLRVMFLMVTERRRGAHSRDLFRCVADLASGCAALRHRARSHDRGPGRSVAGSGSRRGGRLRLAGYQRLDPVHAAVDRNNRRVGIDVRAAVSGRCSRSRRWWTRPARRDGA
jgi:phosphoenolpyruvate-protein kinase (PTS system EI component)